MIMKKNNRVKIISIVILLSIFFSYNAYTETIDMDMETAVMRALEVNFDVKKGQYTLKKARISKFSSWNVLVPNISAGGTLSHLNADIEKTPLNPDPTQWSLRRNITISTPLASRLAQNIIGVFIPYKSYKSGKITYEALLASSIKNIESAYIDLFIASKTLAYQQERLNIEEQKESDAKQSYNSGLTDEYAYLQTQLATLESRQRIEQQQNNYSAKSEQFAIVLDYPLDTEFRLKERIKEINIEDVKDWIIAEDISGNASIQNLAIQEDILKLNRLKTIFGFFPRVNLSWSTSYNYQEKPMENSWFEDNWGGDTGALSYTLSIPISEYHPWSSTAVGLRQLHQDILSNRISQKQTYETQQQVLLIQQRNLETSLHALEIQKTKVKLAKKSFALANEAYAGGLMNITDFNESKDILYKTRLDALTYQGTIIKNILEINIIIGKDIPILAGAKNE